MPTSTRTRQPASRTGRNARQASRPPLAVVGRVLSRLWLMLGMLVGTLARAVGRNAASARELDPAH
ncbi:MAG TPA: hypothetical protein VFU36_08650, partial [Jatrophihabitans sp.]|nr:hypothetical protein [Jatrophihabitans sp.]